MNRPSSQTFAGLRSSLAVCLLLLASAVNLAVASAAHPSSFQTGQPAHKLSREDERFLEDLQRRSFQYFWDQGDPHTGLVPDRARIDATPLDEDHRDVASIAATGFGLTALCIAAEHDWIDRSQARERTRKTLQFFATRAFQQHGWFYHWLDAKTGERRWKS